MSYLDFQMIMTELEALGKERTKKIYMSNGAVEPLFGVNTGLMKSLKKDIKQNQVLAEQLYATGNYDAMYFAGVIAEPNLMTEQDYNRWIERAYFYMISDYVVAVTLAEAAIGEELAIKWIASGEDLKMSAGWSCYCWMLGNRKDESFQHETIDLLLQQVIGTIHTSPNRTKISMHLFITTVGISYQSLHEKALQAAKEIGLVEIESKGKEAYLNPLETIKKEKQKGRIGFKRKYVRC